jgi:hypothetical protein
MLFLAGCAVFRRTMTIPADAYSPGAVLSALENNFARIDHFKGRGRLSVAAPSRSFSLAIDLLIDRPDTLYLRLEAVFGLDVGWLFLNRQNYRFYIPLENLYDEGSLDSLRLERFFKVAPDYDQMVSLLCGLERVQGLAELRLLREEDRLVLSGSDARGAHRYWIDPVRGVVIQSQICDSSGQVLLLQKFDRFRCISGVQVPQTIRIERPLEKQFMTLYYDQISINKKYSAKEIKTKIPASARKASQ